MEISKKESTLLESFDILKDCWSQKKDAIKKAIVKMFEINEDSAIGMWVYILKNNSKLIKEESYDMIGSILYGIENTNHHSDNKKAKKIAISISDNECICDFIYKQNCDLGLCEIEYISWYIFLGMDDTLIKILNFIKSNKNLNDYKIGSCISYAISHLDYIDEFNGVISINTLNTLSDFIDKIEDKKEKARCNGGCNLNCVSKVNILFLADTV